MRRGLLSLLTVVLLIVVSSGPVWAVFPAKECYLPSVGVGSGSGTSYWYTTMWVHNSTTSPVDVRFELLQRDKSNSTPAAIYNDTIPAGDTKQYENAVETVFGIDGRMFGAIRVVASGDLIVNGRIYSKDQSASERDSVGQFFAAVPASFAIGAGESTTLLGVYQTDPQANSEYRYNFGFVETAGTGATVRVTAYNTFGDIAGSKDYQLLAFEPKQFNIRDLLPSVNATNLRLGVEVLPGSAGKVVAFGSGLANRSNDPSTFEMSFKSGLLASEGGSLTLPYSGSTSTNGPAFKVKNTGSGTALEGASESSQPAVRGVASIANGTAVEGRAESGAGAWGVLGASKQGVGVRGMSESGPAVLGSANSAPGVKGVSTSDYGVSGSSTTNVGVYGESPVTAISGFSTGTVGINYGVRGRTGSADGAGVAGYNVATAGRARGVYGFVDANDGQAAGVCGINNNTGNTGELGLRDAGVRAIHSATGNNARLATELNGVYGEEKKSGNWGTLGGSVYGANGTHATTDNSGLLGTKTYGVMGVAESSETNDSGVFGLSSAGLTNGVFGQTTSPTDGATGVFGLNSSTAGSGVGVWGRSVARYGVGGKFENRAEGGSALRLSALASTQWPATGILVGDIIDATGAIQKILFYVDVQGNFVTRGQFSGGWADLAEHIDTSDELSAGDLVEIDPQRPGWYRQSRGPLSTLVAGVISTKPGISLNHQPKDPIDLAAGDDRPQLALVGQVPVKATTENGAIGVGDLLVASSTPGHAMRCVEPARCAGAVVGKALESLEVGSGLVKILVTLQ
jgi:hypothetical protein